MSRKLSHAINLIETTSGTADDFATVAACVAQAKHLIGICLVQRKCHCCETVSRESAKRSFGLSSWRTYIPGVWFKSAWKRVKVRIDYRNNRADDLHKTIGSAFVGLVRQERTRHCAPKMNRRPRHVGHSIFLDYRDYERTLMPILESSFLVNLKKISSLINLIILTERPIRDLIAVRRFENWNVANDGAP